jgi:polysaccharide pyruvyl transferase CsaB
MRPIRILIAGYYGFHNIGDEAILLSMLRGLREGRPETEVAVVSYHPEWTSRTYGVHSLSCFDADSIHRAVRAADVVIIGGGGLFHDYWGIDPHLLLTSSHSGIVYYAGIGLLAALYQKPLMLYAVGVGPLLTEDGRQLTKALFSIASWKTVRDTYSKGVLDSVGVDTSEIQVVPDPSMGIGIASRERVEEIFRDESVSLTRPLVGVAIRNWDVGVSPESWEKEVANALDRFLRERGGNVLFIPFQKLEGRLEDDANVMGRVIRWMERSSQARILNGLYSPEEIRGIVSHCDLLIGMRFHSVLFGVMGEVPLVAIGYDPKVGSLMKDCGYEENLIGLEDIRSDKVKKTLDGAFDHAEEINRRFKEVSSLMRMKNEESLRAAHHFLDSQRVSTYADAGGLALLLHHLLQGHETLNKGFSENKRTLVEKESLLSQLAMAQVQLNQANEALQIIRHSRTWKLNQAVGKRLYGTKIGRVLEKFADYCLKNRNEDR